MARAFVVLVLIGLLLEGCGEGTGGGGTQPSADAQRVSSNGRDANGISGPDQVVVGRIHVYVKSWNRLAADWLTAYQSGDVAEFDRAYSRLTPRLNKVAAHLLLEPAQIDETQLRHGMERLGRSYRREFQGLVALHDVAMRGNVSGARRAERRIRRLGEAKNRLAQQLVDQFPELG